MRNCPRENDIATHEKGWFSMGKELDTTVNGCLA